MEEKEDDDAEGDDGGDDDENDGEGDDGGDDDEGDVTYRQSVGTHAGGCARGTWGQGSGAFRLEFTRTMTLCVP